MVLLVFPLIVSQPYILHVLILCFVYAIVTTNWQLTVGYSGIFNFAHFGFMTIGAYTAAILALRFGVSPWVGLISGACTAAVAGLLIGLPTLRLRGIYFCLFTFAFQQLVYSMILINPGQLTGGSMGLMFIPSLTFGRTILSHTNKLPAYYLALALFFVSTLLLARLVNSRFGLAFKALRDSESYAVSRGISAYKYKLIAVVVSAFFTGGIGAFYAYYMNVLGPSLLSWSIMVLGFAMLVIGGLGALYGPIVAAFVLTIASESLSGLGGYRYLIISGILVAGLFLRPATVAATRRTALGGTTARWDTRRRSVSVILECFEVTKRFGRFAAVDSLSFKVEEGEVFGIAGPNGAGKTTLFNSITGIPYALSAGRIVLDRREISHLKPHQICHRGIARTFQIPRVFEAGTYLENVLVGSIFGGADKHGVPTDGGCQKSANPRDMATEALKLVGLGHKAGSATGGASLFDRKCLMLASAVATQPRLLLLDEPVGGLNRQEVDVFLGLVQQLNKQGLTIIIIEHIMRALMSVSTRVMILNHGRKICEGIPESVGKDPAAIEAYLGEEYRILKGGS